MDTLFYLGDQWGLVSNVQILHVIAYKEVMCHICEMRLSLNSYIFWHSKAVISKLCMEQQRERTDINGKDMKKIFPNDFS